MAIFASAYCIRYFSERSWFQLGEKSRLVASETRWKSNESRKTFEKGQRSRLIATRRRDLRTTSGKRWIFFLDSRFRNVIHSSRLSSPWLEISRPGRRFGVEEV